MPAKQRITLGLGGGCHWCTEAIFSSINGIQDVQQGWLASYPPDDAYSEGVLVKIDTAIIRLKDVINIHIETHSADANHSKRDKYRSAIYVQNEDDNSSALDIISQINATRYKPVITRVMALNIFKLQTEESYLDYYYKEPEKPFCQAYINPKLNKLLALHSKLIAKDKLAIIKKSVATPGIDTGEQPGSDRSHS